MEQMDIERIRAVISELTLEEKIALCGCGADFVSRVLPRLKIPSVRLPHDTYEPLTALGCSFDRMLAEEYGKILSAEAIVNGTALSGPLNTGVIRCPMLEGSERMLGEDAYAVGELVCAVANGARVPLLASGVLGGEYPFAERWIDARALCELYLRPFICAAKKLGGATVPAGTLCGEPVDQSRRFVGLISDCLSGSAMLVNELGAVTDKAAAASAGACFQLVDNLSDNAALYKAVKDGTLFEKRLDADLERVLALIWDDAEKRKAQAVPLELDETFERRLAQRSTVLLKNEELTLPLRQGIAVGVWGDVSKAECAPLERFLQVRYRKAEPEIQLVFLRLDGCEYSSAQVAVVKRAASGGKRAVVVLLADRPAPLRFEKDAAAIWYMPMSNESAFETLGELLTAHLNPSGKLNVSYAYTAQDYPANAYKRAEGRGMFCYESVMNGYRYFNSYSRPVLYPFGHGLSYTGFEISKLKAAVEENVMTVDCVVKNVGMLPGETVVFVFGSLSSDNIFGLKSRLAAFERVSLERGENTAVHFAVDLTELAVYDARSREWLVPGGKYKIEAGFSATDLRADTQIKVPRSTRLNLGLTQKDVPSYYAEDGLNPLGTDVEKVMGVPLLSRQSATAVFCDRPSKADARLLRAAEKKLCKANAYSPMEARRICAMLSRYALEKLVRS